MKLKYLLLASTLLFLSFESSAITLEEIAGAYVGKRTDTLPNEVRRYDEILVIEPDGEVTHYLYADGQTYTISGYIEIAPDGTITSGGGDEARLQLNGNHLAIQVLWYNLLPFGEVHIDIKVHRLKKVPKSFNGLPL